MIERKSAWRIYWLLGLGLLYGSTEGSPMKRPSRMVREVYPEIEPESEGNQAQVCIVGDVVYGMDEAVPAEQPCLKCKCQAPGVQCETIQCVKRPGCKAIHKSNKCCPDYQCECEYNGKFYANGEKLETSPGGECKVCYCRGGEVQCAEVSCYIRKDCEGKRVPGTCCPRYDHCPPIDPTSSRSPYTTEIIVSHPHKDELEPWPITGSSFNSTEGMYSRTQSDFQDENKIPDTNYFEVTTPSFKPADTEHYQNDAAVLPRITIQEIIPERKEIPITAPPKLETEPQGTLVIEEAEVVNNSNDLVVTDADVESSEVSEVFHQPPPVLRVGDKLLFLNKDEFVHDNETSTPGSVITVVGAEGLQRGFEESGEIHEEKIESFNISVSSEAPENNTLLEQSKDLNELLLNTAASTHIFSLVKRKDQHLETSPPPIEISLSTESVEVSNFTADSEAPIEVLPIEMTTLSSSQQILKDIVSSSSPIENVETTSEINTDIKSNVTIEEIVTEQNPAYPPIPEILSPNMDDTSQRFDIENGEKECENTSTIPDPKIIPEVLSKRSNRTVPQDTVHSEWLKTNQNTTLTSSTATLSSGLTYQPSTTNIQEHNTTDILITTESEPVATIEPHVDEPQSSEDKHSRSVEDVDTVSEESGENTTPKSKSAAILSSENASVESKESSELNDMIQKTENHRDDKIEEITTVVNVNLIDHINENRKNDTEKTDDVEIIDTKRLQTEHPSVQKTIVSSTSLPELLPQPEKLILKPLKIVKRDNAADEASHEIFKNLERELNEEQTDKNISSEEEQRESDAIFKELLEDTSTPRSAKNKETDALERVSNALGQFALRSSSSDPSSVLGVLSNFFGPQHRQK